MAYASIPDVSALAAKRVFGATSIPSASQVAQYLNYGAAELDGILAGDGYVVPVPTTATIALGMLNRLNAMAAYAQVEDSAQVSNPNKGAISQWTAARTELMNGKVQLIDLPRLAGANFARAQPTPTPFFTREMQF